jgi:GDP-L-fucose synthase
LKGEDVTLWGSGKPVREFLWADDLAGACMWLMNTYDGEEPINIGSGEYCDLHKLASRIAWATDFPGSIRWDESKPDGTPVRYLDSSKIRSMGWTPKMPLATGLTLAYRDFLSRQ